MFAVMTSVSCKKEETGPTDVNLKLVPSDGTVEVLCKGYSIGKSGSSSTPECVTKGIYSGVEGVVFKFKDGKSFTSNSEGIVTIDLPESTYFYKMEWPTSWYLHYDSHYEGYNNYTYDVYNYRYNGDDYNYDDWGAFEISEGHHVKTISFYKGGKN